MYGVLSGPKIVNFEKKYKIYLPVSKDAFYSESEIRFSNLPKKLFQKTILSLKFEISAHISKQLIQISGSG